MTLEPLESKPARQVPKLKCEITIQVLEKYNEHPDIGNYNEAWDSFKEFQKNVKKTYKEFDIEAECIELTTIRNALARLRRKHAEHKGAGRTDLLDEVESSIQTNYGRAIDIINKIFEKMPDNNRFINPYTDTIIDKKINYKLLRKYYSVVSNCGAIGDRILFMQRRDPAYQRLDLYQQANLSNLMKLDIEEILNLYNGLPAELKEKASTIGNIIGGLCKCYSLQDNNNEASLRDKVEIITKHYNKLNKEMQDFFTEFVIGRTSI